MTQNGWLPAGYKVPKAPSDYMKLEDGANKFRVMSPVVLGYEYWNTQGKPVRLREFPEVIPADCRVEPKGGGKRLKHFWAFVVWNYSVSRQQILEITQSSIQSNIQALVENEDWGEPTGYDITITRKGKDLDTEYSVQPSPHKPVPQAAVEAYRTTKIDLEKLFEGADPIQRTEDAATKAFDDAIDETSGEVVID